MSEKMENVVKTMDAICDECKAKEPFGELELLPQMEELKNYVDSDEFKQLKVYDIIMLKCNHCGVQSKLPAFLAAGMRAGYMNPNAIS